MENFRLEHQDPKIESMQEKQEDTEVIRKIHRGVWAEQLVNNQELPVGGSLFSEELTIKLELDLATFDEQLEGFTEERIREVYEQKKEEVEDWLEKIGSGMDSYTYFLCHNIQQKIHKLLEIDSNNQINSLERNKMYSGQKVPKLSELKGKTKCGERAALGQYLLQKIGVESVYVGGATMRDPKDTDEVPESHSFIVLEHPTNSESNLIFDIARPHPQHNIPRVLETDVSFNYDLLKNKEELFVGATELLKGGRLWFGVGDPAPGHHIIN
jgi:hypothetical protein